MVRLKGSKKAIVSYKMSRIRAKNTGIEKRLASALRKHGLHGYRKNQRGIPGTPDFCWKGKKIAVFCDSSFWHGYDWKNQIKTIKTRKKFWVDKIETNIDRDKRINQKLRKEGWKVLRFWDFDINKNADQCAIKVKRLFKERKMLYFAYGSNMNSKQMEQRCPSSKFIKQAYKKGYKFVYDGSSKIRGKAVANIVRSKGDIVWGGLFEINEDNLAALDCYEGYSKKPKNSYDRKLMKFIDDKETPHKAIVYFRTGEKVGMPNKDYRDIVIQGANDCKLPKDYIKNNL